MKRYQIPADEDAGEHGLMSARWLSSVGSHSRVKLSQAESSWMIPGPSQNSLILCIIYIYDILVNWCYKFAFLGLRWENLNNVWDLATSREPRCWWDLQMTNFQHLPSATDLLAPKNPHPHHIAPSFQVAGPLQQIRWHRDWAELCGQKSYGFHMVSTIFHHFPPFSTIFPPFSTIFHLQDSRHNSHDTDAATVCSVQLAFRDSRTDLCVTMACHWSTTCTHLPWSLGQISCHRQTPDMGKTWEDLWTQRGSRCLWLRYSSYSCKQHVKKNFENTILKQLHIAIIFLSYLQSFSHGTPKMPDSPNRIPAVIAGIPQVPNSLLYDAGGIQALAPQVVTVLMEVPKCWVGVDQSMKLVSFRLVTCLLKMYHDLSFIYMAYIRKKHCIAIQMFYLVFDSGVYAALQEHRVKDIIVPRNYEDGTYGAKMLFHES